MVIDDLYVARKLISLESGAVRRKLRFSVSFAKLKRELTRKRCYYTGVEINHDLPPNHISIDRIDNDKGYTDENIVGCANSVNLLKANLTVEEIGKLYNKIK